MLCWSQWLRIITSIMFAMERCSRWAATRRAYFRTGSILKVSVAVLMMAVASPITTAIALYGIGAAGCDENVHTVEGPDRGARAKVLKERGA